jgi:putative transposase
MPKTIYLVKLNKKQYRELQHLTKKKTTTPRTVKRVRILLLAHEGIQDSEIVTRVEVSICTVQNIRRRFQTEGLNLLKEKPRPGRPSIFDGATRAKITALACTTPPEGRGQWSYRLLADKAVEILKKMRSNPNGFVVGA